MEQSKIIDTLETYQAAKSVEPYLARKDLEDEEAPDPEMAH